MLTQEASALALKKALKALGMVRGKERGLYAPLVKRSPLYVDDAIPKHIQQNLEEHQTCACTDNDIVYIDTSRAKEMFALAKSRKFSNRKQVDVDMLEATDDYCTLLAHEYTHVLMRHVEKGIKFIKANGSKYYPIFALACDIEANRGWAIRDWSDIYSIGVSDASYPECRGVEGLMNIYRVLKKKYGDEIMRNYEEAKEELDEGEEGEGKNDDNGESADGGGSGASKPEPVDAKAEQRKQAIKNNVRSMEQMRDEMEKREARMSEEELNENIEQYDEERGEEAAASGVGGDAEGLYSGSPQDVLNSKFSVENKIVFERALSKLKGIVKGSQVRTRVSTYSRPSRRSSADGLIRKGVKSGKELAPKILVAMDSSGSMHSTSVTPVAEAIGTLARMLGKTKGSYICEHDGDVRNVQPLSKWESVVKGYYPQGDNDFDAVLRKALELDVSVVLNVGDGYACFYDDDLQKQAKKRGIKWIDVQVAGELETLQQRVYGEDRARFGDGWIGREVIVARIGSL